MFLLSLNVGETCCQRTIPRLPPRFFLQLYKACSACTSFVAFSLFSASRMRFQSNGRLFPPPSRFPLSALLSFAFSIFYSCMSWSRIFFAFCFFFSCFSSMMCARK
ncbi:hypothetical protein BDV98DRAFT_570647 [Pterulicium gracile]|uniref:Uncharacterized protein n=1 Tax=Pterulicium gracile TaxID=1884261 RepID=A0A5C3QC70_9AGAR|nr:hypothetical protein BDV98DRAFT_570647 [Pterula gracilis]